MKRLYPYRRMLSSWGGVLRWLLLVGTRAIQRCMSLMVLPYSWIVDKTWALVLVSRKGIALNKYFSWFGKKFQQCHGHGHEFGFREKKGKSRLHARVDTIFGAGMFLNQATTAQIECFYEWLIRLIIISPRFLFQFSLHEWISKGHRDSEDKWLEISKHEEMT